MAQDMGEHVAGEYLKRLNGCDVINYNVRARNGGSEGLNELDVVGFNFETRTVYLCEVATHLGGLNYGGKSVEHTIEKVLTKHAFQKHYAGKYLTNFENRRYMLWSPRVSVGKITAALEERAPDLELVINERYTAAVGELRNLASKNTSFTADPFFPLCANNG